MFSSYPSQNFITSSDQMEMLYQSIHTGSIRFTSEQILNFIDQTRRNLTLTIRSITHAYHLDKEWNYDIYERDDHGLIEQDASDTNNIIHPVISAGQGQVVTKVLRTVGRATSYRERKSDFSTRRHIDPDAERRSAEANFKAARRKAADKAIHRNLCTWVSFTFDNEHLHVDPQVAIERFNRNLRNYIHENTSHAFHYCEVLTVVDHRQHIHGLLPEWIEWQLVYRYWIYGHAHIVPITKDEIEEKVGYMADHIKQSRVTNHRFIESHGDMPIPEYFISNSYSDARDVLEDDLAPNRITPTMNKPFTPDGLISYRFLPTEPA